LRISDSGARRAEPGRADGRAARRTEVRRAARRVEDYAPLRGLKTFVSCVFSRFAARFSFKVCCGAFLFVALGALLAIWTRFPSVSWRVPRDHSPLPDEKHFLIRRKKPKSRVKSRTRRRWPVRAI